MFIIVFTTASRACPGFSSILRGRRQRYGAFELCGLPLYRLKLVNEGLKHAAQANALRKPRSLGFELVSPISRRIGVRGLRLPLHIGDPCKGSYAILVGPFGLIPTQMPRVEPRGGPPCDF